MERPGGRPHPTSLERACSQECYVRSRPKSEFSSYSRGKGDPQSGLLVVSRPAPRGMGRSMPRRGAWGTRDCGLLNAPVIESADQIGLYYSVVLACGPLVIVTVMPKMPRSDRDARTMPMLCTSWQHRSDPELKRGGHPRGLPLEEGFLAAWKSESNARFRRPTTRLSRLGRHLRNSRDLSCDAY